MEAADWECPLHLPPGAGFTVQGVVIPVTPLKPTEKKGTLYTGE